MNFDSEFTGDAPEVEINIEPRVDRLVDLGVSPEEFEAAVMNALDRMDAVLDSVEDPESVPALDDIEVELQGKRILLGEIATITINGDLEDEDDEADFEEEDLDGEDDLPGTSGRGFLPN